MMRDRTGKEWNSKGMKSDRKERRTDCKGEAKDREGVGKYMKFDRREGSTYGKGEAKDGRSGAGKV